MKFKIGSEKITELLLDFLGIFTSGEASHLCRKLKDPEAAALEGCFSPCAAEFLTALNAGHENESSHPSSLVESSDAC